jgi:ABC-type Mn2+/Zn2+ transport system permease subunit
VVLRAMAFLGDALAHAILPGVAIAYLLGANLLLGALVAAILVAVGIGVFSRRGGVKEDTAIGIFFAATMALGILFIGLMGEYNVDLFGYLFGSVLSVTREDLWLSGVLGAGVLGVIGLFFKELLFITFDPEMAQVSGLPARGLYVLLLSIMALTVVLAIKVVGIILVSAMIVIPAAAAYQLTEDFRAMMAVAVLIGNVSAVAGLFLSYRLDTASGATMVLTATAVFFLSAILSPRRWRSHPATSRRSRSRH